MKSMAVRAVAVIAAFSVAGGASANHFEPKAAPFKAVGAFNVSQNIGDACKAVFRGETGSDGATVTSAVFLDRPVKCPLTATGLPWRMTTHAPDSLTIHGMGATSDSLFCTGDVKAQLTSLGQIVFSTNLGRCALNGTLITRPQLKSVSGK